MTILLYFSSTSDASGRSRITISFENGKIQIPQVQVQNKISDFGVLPDASTASGSQCQSHLVIPLWWWGYMTVLENQPTSRYLIIFNPCTLDNLNRIDGVGETDVFGSQHAIREFGWTPIN